MIISSGSPRIRSALVMLTVAALVATGAETIAARGANAEPVASAALTSSVEDDGADCPVTLPGALTSNAKLPDPFLRLNGTRISAVSDWRCRREEILQLSEKYVYGQKAAKPASVTGTVSRTGITVNVSDNGKSASFSASVTLPSSGSGPFPAVIVYGGIGADTATIESSGAAVINYNPLDVGAEGTARSNKQGAYYTLYGSTSSTGLLMAWAWGVSRIIDVINQAGGSILTSSVGVTGCSRYGKGAFVAGAFDQRVALTMPIESGTDGVPILRGIPGESGAQPLAEAYGEQPWVGDAFSAFTGNPNTLPVDTHEVVGLIAPRGLFIMENPHIDWLAATSGSVAALGGREIYTALGAQSNISYWSDVQDGTHCAVRPEWTAPLQQSIKAFLLNSGAGPGVFRISSLKSGNLAGWRDWTTPTLSNGSPPATSASRTTQPPTTPPPTSPPPTSPPPTTPPPTTPPPTTPPPPPTSPPPTTAPPSGCTASVAVNQWPGGFTASINVTAGASAIHSWTVTMSLPSGASVTNTWNASANGSSGAVQFANASYDGSLSAGQTTNFGFQGTGTGQGMTVTSCAAS